MALFTDITRLQNKINPKQNEPPTTPVLLRIAVDLLVCGWLFFAVGYCHDAVVNRKFIGVWWVDFLGEILHISASQICCTQGATGKHECLPYRCSYLVGF